VYALLGSSRQLNVAPEASLSLLVGQAIADATHDKHGPVKNSDMIGLAMSTMITLQVCARARGGHTERLGADDHVQAGLFCFALGFFRLGFIDVVLSRALLQGFISAVAVVIMVSVPPAHCSLSTHQRRIHTGNSSSR
jgi:MFS superfamily sulfate permease-like transporter